jgi:heme/copper-type cytochrome/quinol oxidase subunit 4
MNEIDKPGQKTNETFGIVKGFGMGIGLCILQGAVTWGIASGSGNQKGLTVLVIGLMFFGLIQLVYVVPLFLFLRKRRPATATGLAIAASLVALVNIACATKMNLR